MDRWDQTWLLALLVAAIHTFGAGRRQNLGSIEKNLLYTVLGHGFRKKYELTRKMPN